MNSTFRSTAVTMNVTMTSITETLVSTSLESVYETLKVMWYVCLPPLLLLGSLGNILTTLVVQLNMQRNKNRNDPSSPQLMLQALAVADFLVLWVGGLVMWLYYCAFVHIDHSHTAMCKLLVWLVFSLSNTSAWMVTAVTIQRTMAIRLPHRMKVLWSPRRTRTAIAVIFITPSCMQSHFLVGIEISDGWCRYTSPEYAKFVLDIWVWFIMVINTVLPFLCQFVCDVLLGRALIRASYTTSAPAAHTSRRQIALRTTVMVLLLSTTFLLLTLPFLGVVIWHAIHWEYMTLDTQATWYLAMGVTNVLWYTNSAVNFLLYCATGGLFRKQLVSMMRSVWTRVTTCPCSQQ